MFSNQPTRPVQMGYRGAVATNHPVATRVGADMLAAGATAVDAAIAISFALGVAEPHMSGLGGDGFFTVHQDGSTCVFDGSGAAPLSVSPDDFRGGLPLSGADSIAVPGLLDMLGLLHRRFGRKAWCDLVAPAIQLARTGVPVTAVHRKFTSASLARLQNGNGAPNYLPGGCVPPLGHRLTNTALAATLDCVAEHGARTMYDGVMADRMARDLASVGARVTGRDLGHYRACERAPIAMAWGDATLVQTPLPSTGFVLMAEAALLRRFDISALLGSPVDLVHTMVEIKKQAFALRERLARDPQGLAPEFEEMLPADVLDEIAARVDLRKAAFVPLIQPGPGEGNTTYFAVMDENGNAVSAIQSLNNAFGSGVLLPETGILMNNRMTCFHLDPQHTNALRPGGTVRHTMNAPMLIKDGEPLLCLGTPGADNQVQVNFQALVAQSLFKFDPQTTCELPRWTSDQPGQEANWPHGGLDLLTIEEGFPSGVVEGLRARGHTVTVIPHLSGPSSLEIIERRQDGLFLAGSDPRRDGWAAAF